MKLLIFNGSPKGEKGNTQVVIDHFSAGFASQTGNICHVCQLNRRSQFESYNALLADADVIVFAMPLYIHALPSIVHDYFCQMPVLPAEKKIKMAFLVQYGFQEAHHGRYIEKYLKKFAGKVNAVYAGCMLRGNSAGLTIMPALMTRKIFKQFNQLGASLAQQGRLDDKLVAEIGGSEFLSAGDVKSILFMDKLGLLNGYWNSEMKKNGVLDKSFAQPFQDEVKA